MKIVLHVDWHRDQYLENMLWPVAMDRRETWTMKKKHENKIKAFEMNQLGQILHIFWMEIGTNEWVLEKAYWYLSRDFLESLKWRKHPMLGLSWGRQASVWRKKLYKTQLMVLKDRKLHKDLNRQYNILD